jgi:hypothetical protein
MNYDARPRYSQNHCSDEGLALIPSEPESKYLPYNPDTITAVTDGYDCVPIKLY